MKYLFIVLTFFVLQTVKGQTPESIDNTPKKSASYYSLKQHQNKEAAKICLLTGAGLVVVGSIVAIAGIANSESSATPIGAGMFVLGVTSAVASVPLFIFASSNKRKARLSLKTETVFYGIKGSSFKSPSLSLTIPFN
jgi:FtsH-binding integral membrane protein